MWMQTTAFLSPTTTRVLIRQTRTGRHRRRHRQRDETTTRSAEQRDGRRRGAAVRPGKRHEAGIAQLNITTRRSHNGRVVFYLHGYLLATHRCIRNACKTIRTGNETDENNGLTNDRAIVCVTSYTVQPLPIVGWLQHTTSDGRRAGGSKRREAGNGRRAEVLEFNSPKAPRSWVKNRNKPQIFYPLPDSYDTRRKSSIKSKICRNKKKILAVLPFEALLWPQWARVISKCVIRPKFTITTWTYINEEFLNIIRNSLK